MKYMIFLIAIVSNNLKQSAKKIRLNINTCNLMCSSTSTKYPLYCRHLVRRYVIILYSQGSR